MEYLHFVYDGVILAVLILFFWLGWRKGFLLSVCGLAVAVLALLGAGLLADQLAVPTARAIAPSLESALEKSLTLHGEDLGAANALDALRQGDGLSRWAAELVQDAAGTTDHAPALSQLVSSASQVLAQRIAYGVLFALSFLLLLLLLTLLLHALDLVAKLPGLRFCNELGGGIIGLAKGGALLFAAVSVLMVSPWQPAPELLEKTFLLKLLVRYDPVFLLFPR